MASHTATVVWKRREAPFTDLRYDRRQRTHDRSAGIEARIADVTRAAVVRLR